MRRVTVDIPDWLYKALVFVVLLCRQLRFGYPFRRIPLTRGKFAIEDPDDYEWLAEHKWFAQKTRGCFYAGRRLWQKQKKCQKTVLMHSLILPVAEGLVVDHINRNGLDNRKANLRSATRAQNRHNSPSPRKKTSSRLKGVHICHNKFRARIGINNRKIHLGSVADEIDAAKAYDTAAKKYHKEFAVLNFAK